MAKKKTSENQSAKQKNDNIFKRTIQGRIVSFNFFKKNWPAVAGVLILFLVFIANKYHCQTQQAQIMTLKTELNNAKTERVKASSEYNSKIRETEMRRLIDTMNLTIAMPEQPPFKLQSDEATK